MKKLVSIALVFVISVLLVGGLGCATKKVDWSKRIKIIDSKPKADPDYGYVGKCVIENGRLVVLSPEECFRRSCGKLSDTQR